MKGKRVLLPVRSKRWDGCGRKDLGRVVVDEAHRNRTDGGIGCLGVKRTLINRIWPDGNAPETFVRDARRLAGRSVADGKSQTLRQSGAWPHGWIDHHCCIGIARFIKHPVEGLPAPVVLESAVPHKFGVQTAIVRVVDLLSHQAIKHRAHLAFNLVHVDPQSRRLRSLG